MRTRLLFLENGEPVKGIRVKPDSDATDVTESDQEGQLSLELAAGNKELVVYHAGSWVPHVIRVEEQASLILVDLKDVGAANKQSKPKEATNFLDIGRLDLGERYVFERVLGRGGMGLVIKARDRLLNRSVAIKLLSDELTESREAQQIFLAEARHLATLAHPNLVAVHDISKADDRVFMVIEYVKGETLEKLVRSLKKLSLPITLKLAIQLTRVVSYLHDHGVIHRDLKLANAMVRHDGTLKLVDFGLARHFDELYIRGTRVRGTPAYMSPEQINGDHLSPTSDVYQLGLCLFEMITGRLPFEGGDVMYAHIHTPAPSVTQFLSDVPKALDQIISRCLSKDPQDRYQDGHGLLKDLQQLHHNLDRASAITSSGLHVEGEQQDEERVSYPRLHTQELASLTALRKTTGMSFDQQHHTPHAISSQDDPMRASQIKHPTHNSLHALTEPKRISPAFLILFALIIVAASVLAQKLLLSPPAPAAANIAALPASPPAPATPTTLAPEAPVVVTPPAPKQEEPAADPSPTPEPEVALQPTTPEPSAEAAPAPEEPAAKTSKRPRKRTEPAPTKPTRDEVASTPAPKPSKAKPTTESKPKETKGLFKLGSESTPAKADEPVELRKGFLPMK